MKAERRLEAAVPADAAGHAAASFICSPLKTQAECQQSPQAKEGKKRSSSLLLLSFLPSATIFKLQLLFLPSFLPWAGGTC